MNALQNKYKNRGFTILAVPSSQFANQEPGSKKEIMRGLEFVRPGDGFKPAFPMTQKVHVNGVDAHGLYKFLRNACPDSPQQHFSKKHRLNYEDVHASDIRWNFEKFLIDRYGKPIRRYHSSVGPADIEKDIEVLLEHA